MQSRNDVKGLGFDGHLDQNISMADMIVFNGIHKLGLRP